MFGLIGTIIVGFVVGVIAKLIMPGKENMGFIMTTLLGIVARLRPPTSDKRSAGTKRDKAPVGSAPSSAHS